MQKQQTPTAVADFSTIPEHFLLCFNSRCELGETCLHRIAAGSGALKDEMVTAVNPAVNGGDSCKYYKENRVTVMAYGMKDSFHDVRADDIAALRETLISHFGRGSYYLRRNGLRAITPEEQQYISSVFRSFGYEAHFDRTAEETCWL